MQKRIFYLLAVLSALAVLAIVIAADRGTLPPFLARLYAFPNGDKVGHFLLMGALAFALMLGLPTKSKPLGLVVLGLAITLEEISQLFFPRRTFSLLDLGCSLLGVAVMGGLGLWLTHSHKPRGADGL